MDVTKADDWKAVVAFAQSQFTRVDILVNNAGWIYRRKDTTLVSETDYDKVFDINVKSIFHATKALVPYFLERRSANIVNIGSCIIEKPTTGLTWYGATKGAVDMITRHLAAEHYPKGICVNGISPSIGETALLREFIAQEPDLHNKASLAASASLNRLCTPLDVAKGALYFATLYFNDFQTRESPTPFLLLLINLLEGHYSSSGRGKLYIERVLASTNTTALKRPRFNPVHQQIYQPEISLYAEIGQ